MLIICISKITQLVIDPLVCMPSSTISDLRIQYLFVEVSSYVILDIFVHYIIISISKQTSCVATHVKHRCILIEHRWTLVRHAVIYWVVAHHFPRVSSAELIL